LIIHSYIDELKLFFILILLLGIIF